MSNHLAVAVAIVINAHKFPAQITQELVRFASTTLSQPQRSVRNKKIISQKTIEARLYGVCSSIDTLINLKFEIKTLVNVGEKHIAALHADHLLLYRAGFEASRGQWPHPAVPADAPTTPH